MVVITSDIPIDVPNIDVVTWLFESTDGPLSDEPLIFSAEDPDNVNLSLTQYRSFAKRLGSGLVKLGLKPQDKVLVFSGNHIFYPVAFMGIVMAEGVFTGANPSYTARELAYQLKDSDAKFCFTAPESLETTLQAAKLVGLPRKHIFLLDDDLSGKCRDGVDIKAAEIGGHWTQLLAEKDDFVWKTFTTLEQVNRTAAINYSSGTTGLPKGVEITHRNYIANITSGLAFDDPRRHPWEPVWLAVLPMYHAFGQNYFVLYGPKLGFRTYYMSLLYGHTNEEKRAIERFQITALISVPPILVALAKHPAATKKVLKSVRRVGSGAAPFSKEAAQQVEAKLNPEYEVKVGQGWGMTETTLSVLGQHKDYVDHDGSVGVVQPGCQAKIMNPDGTKDLPYNTDGELWVRGPQIMKGYYRKPQATAETLTADGWLKTGDIARISPKGLFYIVDRKKELIKVKGFQVAPAELEAALLEHEDIMDAGVVGITIAGKEKPRAYLLKRPGSHVTSEAIMKYMQKAVAPHKQITGGIVWCEEIPKNPSGKILRKILRERASKEVAENAPPKASL